jgi:hypothetical protein
MSETKFHTHTEPQAKLNSIYEVIIETRLIKRRFLALGRNQIGQPEYGLYKRK